MRFALKFKVFTAVLLTIATQFAVSQTHGIETEISDDSAFVVVPNRDMSTSIDHVAGDMSFDISSRDSFRVYEVTHEGNAYVAYASLHGEPKHLVFDTTERRFRTLTNDLILLTNSQQNLHDDLRANPLIQSAKAFPELGFVVVAIDAGTNPATVVTQLSMDPRVESVHLAFEDQFNRRPIRATGSIDAHPLRNAVPNTKDAMISFPSLSASLNFNSIEPAFYVSMYNLGSSPSETATLETQLATMSKEVADDGTTETTLSLLSTSTTPVLPLDPKGASITEVIQFPTEDLDGDRTYFALFTLYAGEDIDFTSDILAQGASGFTLDHMKRIRHTCVSRNSAHPGSGPDPLQSEQWHLDNTGQTAFAAEGGVSGEDMQMQNTLENGPTGDGIRVAVVDTGMELCHPDLWENVEQGASYNFNAAPIDEYLNENPSHDPWRLHYDAMDPFNFDPTHGHGTAVAGIIAATAENRLGVQGVAPGVLVRGYNLINAETSVTNDLEALGASYTTPNSAEVDVFNMSFGQVVSRPAKIPVYADRLMRHGVENLRAGKGALYIKSAGNSFTDCTSFHREINDDIGCMSSLADPLHAMPFGLIVGAHNADGKRSSYSTAGASLWISAPGGEYGSAKPAIVSLDPMDSDRGFAVLEEVFGGYNELENDTELNPDGDYTSVMNGTSAAAPNVAGAVAILLEENPRFDMARR